jgi:glycosyltransferase involved in cell wall biosynthesis
MLTVCLNSAHTLRCALDSVSGQRYQAVSHLVVDGGSIDSTLSLLTRYPHKHMQFVSRPDRGIYHAMNNALSLAEGDVLGFLNADDLLASEAVIQRVAAAFEDDSVQVCYGDLQYVSAGDTSKVIRHWKAGPFKAGAFATGWVPPHPTFFARRSVYGRYGGFDESYEISADAELMMRLMEKHRLKVAYIPEVLVKMRVGGVSNRSARNVLKGNRNILRALRANGLPANAVRYAAGRALRRAAQFIEARRQQAIS